MNFIELSEKQDKVQKAQPIIARASQGKLHLPGFEPWIEDAIAEILSFPNGSHDDFVDMLACIGRGLDLQTPATAQRTDRRRALPVTGTMGWIKEADNRRRRDAERRRLVSRL